MTEAKTHITVQDFAKAMQQLDLSGVPEERRQYAIAEHVHKVLTESISDPAAKIAALAEIHDYRKRLEQAEKRNNARRAGLIV